eukprot:CAMPEP_0174352086 /NCGR_PEP_ID=MMETSP0811_2-20130205/9639_1 /TAXON_ID=73025 ORGANISM="Eutreptiella gymnastica-like, Strain CCMP1594" /NCGR_SAMPLE_ID=MMETSP0811_2 /ASSEMBLY_ACC=CAM_ASM_000667 /LENGTH=166 /DNA_ID=CAMNT_0015481937 /DNA_START=598 /DNA_END=1095 /DNA_ORIENTATION=+
MASKAPNRPQRRKGKADPHTRHRANKIVYGRGKMIDRSRWQTASVDGACSRLIALKCRAACQNKPRAHHQAEVLGAEYGNRGKGGAQLRAMGHIPVGMAAFDTATRPQFRARGKTFARRFPMFIRSVASNHDIAFLSLLAMSGELQPVLSRTRAHTHTQTHTRRRT